MSHDNDNHPLLLRIGEVERTVGLGRSSIYRKIEQGAFPKPVSIGTAAVRWRYGDVAQWVEKLGEAA